jgi:hypothetical protein
MHDHDTALWHMSPNTPTKSMRAAVAAFSPPQPDRVSDRNWSMFCDVIRDGKTYRSVGDEHGVSTERVVQIVRNVWRDVIRESRQRASGHAPMHAYHGPHLHERYAHIREGGLRKLLSRIHRDGISPRHATDEELLAVRNLGHKTLWQIRVLQRDGRL